MNATRPGEQKLLWLAGTALLGVFLGVGVLVYLHQALGLAIIFAASIALIVSALRMASAAPSRERKPLLITVVGYVLLLASGISVLFFSSALAGAALLLLGALTGLVGSTLSWFLRTPRDCGQFSIGGRS
jgi:hypothetical protein